MNQVQPGYVVLAGVGVVLVLVICGVGGELNEPASTYAVWFHPATKISATAMMR